MPNRPTATAATRLGRVAELVRARRRTVDRATAAHSAARRPVSNSGNHGSYCSWRRDSDNSIMGTAASSATAEITAADPATGSARSTPARVVTRSAAPSSAGER
ncbi:Uncharacterised protein [Mycobacteroides abscessus subsp. abscessus]|nr:Uncharacterised protein [Mycobacteroides abscessus subsp. abscessus]